jgi:2-dehydro-3-deoxyphosphogluconate aldolase/(4S)-4-hydroxy-2-oxoglutarate aldolase
MSKDLNNPKLDALKKIRVVAVVRAPSAELAWRAAETLVDNGITGIEITFTTPDAASVIKKCRDNFGDRALVGAGTVITAEQLLAATQSGAQFLVSPGTEEVLTRAMLDSGLLTMTGALTPTEVMIASRLGVHVIKVFPGSLGGPGYLSVLRGPFPDLKFMPTGGVSSENVAEWFKHGAFAVGAGGDLVSAKALQEGNMEEIARKAKQYVAACAHLDRLDGKND